MRPSLFKRVDRLVAMSVLAAVGMTWFVLVGFDAFTIFIGELNDVGRGGYTLAKAASYTLLTVPRRLYEMYGYAALIGGLLGLGGLAGTGELTALRAAGMSKLRICASVVLTLARRWRHGANKMPEPCRLPRNRRTSPWPKGAQSGRATAIPSSAPAAAAADRPIRARRLI
jgi:hypothetical protein